MAYRPIDIVNYIFDNGFDHEFMIALMKHKENFSIGEITDKKLLIRGDKVRLISKSYDINVDTDDEKVFTSVNNQLYVSAFISRKDNKFSVHFLTHEYPESMKDKFEDVITDEVVRYMAMMTVIALRLDTPKKAEEYAFD